LGCVKDAGVSCGPPLDAIDSYVFRFSASGGTTLTVPMGQTLPWTVNGQNLLVRNHRSYESGFCDDYWNWAYTIAAQ
jgi:hypothetical protein